MKKRSIIYYVAALLVTMATSCVKVIDKFNSNNLTGQFNAAGPKYLTADVTVNGKDSIQFSYTGTATKPIAYVQLQKNGTFVTSDSIKTGDRMSFSINKKLIADTAAGSYIYKVVAYDANSIYIGSSTTITVTTTPDFYYYTNRKLFAPDTTSKSNPCYINLATGTTYSYNDVTSGNLSAKVDLGYFFNTDIINTGTVAAPVLTPVGHTFYAPSSTPTASQRTFYDVSTWTKNATQISIASTPTFATLLSGGGLKTGATAALKAATNLSMPTYTPGVGVQSPAFKPIVAGNIIYFKTAAGKYGAINIIYINQGNPTPKTYVLFDYKIQR
ncbi:MAG: hypothetical protein ABIN91_04715 [Mucilaginibacter sp.]|uniref:hypothetical protein n=1 Tax=Mucilaginibacter sp. TaxID=1882438 RepID=UPI003265FA4E